MCTDIVFKKNNGKLKIKRFDKARLQDTYAVYLLKQVLDDWRNWNLSRLKDLYTITV